MLRGKRQRALLFEHRYAPSPPDFKDDPMSMVSLKIGNEPKNNKSHSESHPPAEMLFDMFRFLSDICCCLEIPSHIQRVACKYVLVCFGEKIPGRLVLEKLGSDGLALVVAALQLAAKAQEIFLTGNDPEIVKCRRRLVEIVDVAVRLASIGEGNSMSIERFYHRRKIMREKAGIMESLLVRILGPEMDPSVRGGNFTNMTASRFALDFYRSPSSIAFTDTTIDEAAVRICRVLGIPADNVDLNENSEIVAKCMYEMIGFYRWLGGLQKREHLTESVNEPAALISPTPLPTDSPIPASPD